MSIRSVLNNLDLILSKKDMIIKSKHTLEEIYMAEWLTLRVKMI